MTPTPIALLQQVADYDLKLGFEPPDTLTLQPARLCSVEFAEALKAHKPALLALLRLPFCMAYSRTLEETIYFCDDDDTWNCLIEAGAPPWCVYWLAELRILLDRHREAPLSVDELLCIHMARRSLNGTIA